MPGNGPIPPGTPGGTLKRRASDEGNSVPPVKKFVLAYVNQQYLNLIEGTSGGKELKERVEGKKRENRKKEVGICTRQ